MQYTEVYSTINKTTGYIVEKRLKRNNLTIEMESSHNHQRICSSSVHRSWANY